MGWFGVFPKSSSARTFTKRKVMKNIYLLAAGFFFLFSASMGFTFIQSSLHREEGLGAISQSAAYSGMVLSCLFLPRLMIRKLGHKWTVALCMLGYMARMAAQAYAVWATMIPTNVIAGMAGAAMWTAQCAYYTEIASLYAQLSGEECSAVLSRFFGIFFLVFQSSGVVGSIISSTVLRSRTINGSELVPPTEEEIALCGFNDCPWNNVTNPNFERTPQYLIWILVGIYLTVASIGLLIVALFLDPIPKDLVKVVQALKIDSERTKNEGDKKDLNGNYVNDAFKMEENMPAKEERELKTFPSMATKTCCDVQTQTFPNTSVTCKRDKEADRITAGIADDVEVPEIGTLKEVGRELMATVMQWRLKEQLILIPITVWSGVEQTFNNADYTKSYVTCVLGIWMVGMVRIPQAVVDATSSLGWGAVVKITGRIPVMTFGACLHLCLLVTLLFWYPHPDNIAVIFIIAVLWGCCNAIWQTQISALYGDMFPDKPEAAFANYRIWESIGSISAWGYSSHLCTSVKVYILLAVLITGMSGYGVAEVLHRKAANNTEHERQETQL